MELLNNETIYNYSLESEGIKGSVMVRNGKIEKCNIVTIDNDIDFNETEIRSLHKEFGLLLSAIDKQKGVGRE